jgi:hypothetical protein
MKRLIATATALSFAFCLSTLAAQPGQGAAGGSASQEKPDPKPAASIAGKWTMTITTQNGTQNPGLDFKQDGKKVTGTISGPQGDLPITGEYADGKLTFGASIQTNNGEMQLAFAGTLKADGSLAGTLNLPQGELAWSAVRVKDK